MCGQIKHTVSKDYVTIQRGLTLSYTKGLFVFQKGKLIDTSI